MKFYRQNDYSVRKLLPKEWERLKAIRLEAGKREPNIFITTLAEEKKREDREWQQRLKDTERAYFALFHHDDLVGMTGIARHSQDPSTGVLVVSYIHPDHRGQGLSNLYYQARIDWALKKNLRKLIVSHHKKNDASRAAIRKHYFEPTHREIKKWPDGHAEEQLFYQLDLQKWRDVYGE